MSFPDWAAYSLMVVHGIRAEKHPTDHKYLYLNGFFVRLALNTISETKCSPMPPPNPNRHGQILQENELSPAHIAPVGLQQEFTLALCGAQTGPIVKYAPVSAICAVPDEVVALLAAKFLHMGG